MFNNHCKQDDVNETFLELEIRDVFHSDLKDISEGDFTYANL